MKKPHVTIIGPAILDVLAGPIGDDIFRIGTMPMEKIKLTYGGNAYNEASVLKRVFGLDVDIITKIGEDEAGIKIFDQIKKLGIRTNHIIKSKKIETGINIVLYDTEGERRFLTNPNSSLRKLSELDIMQFIPNIADIVSFSCMFISNVIDIPAMERIFSSIKESKKILVVDLTKAKNGENIRTLKPLLKYIDYIFPNEDELNSISIGSIEQTINELLSEGLKNIVLKSGDKGCTIYSKNGTESFGAYKSTVIDTTGAGDCFAAGFIYGLYKNMSLRECALMGNATASCCVECVGATEGVDSKEKVFSRFYHLC